jgi:hypothetical protein
MSITIQEAINKLQAYRGPSKLTLHPGADETLLAEVESAYGVTLPDDFKTLYRFSDGFETDEDIFNMIPLAEIKNNKDRDSPLYIAEYLIYSEMWRLEINPDNCNDYKIMVEFNGNQLLLTNSLAEFVDRFLNGGVFDAGGLYDWHEEIETQPIYSTKLQTARFLLTVFYYGLRYNIIHEKEVIDWADRLVMHENEPDPFFIDLSLGHDKNTVINILYAIAVPDNSLVARAILGLLYHRLSVGAITVSDAVVVIDKHDFSGRLTKIESQDLYCITDETWRDESINGDVELGYRILKLVSIYKEFEISNYKYWYGYDSRIEYQFQEKEKSLVTQIPKEQLSKSYFNTQLIPNVILYSLALISVIVLITTHPLVESRIAVANFGSGLYQILQTFFAVFVCCYLLKGGVWLVKKVAAIFHKL